MHCKAKTAFAFLIDIDAVGPLTNECYWVNLAPIVADVT